MAYRKRATAAIMLCDILSLFHLHLRLLWTLTACSRTVCSYAAMPGDPVRCDLCVTQIRGHNQHDPLSEQEKSTFQTFDLVKCSFATRCHNQCLQKARRIVMKNAAARPKTRSNPSSLQQPRYNKKTDLQVLTGRELQTACEAYSVSSGQLT